MLKDGLLNNVTLKECLLRNQKRKNIHNQLDGAQ